VHVDRFGNLITNLPFIWLAEAGAEWRERWTCEVAGRELPLVRTYGEAPGDGAVALVNSYDRMEVALAGGSAARALGLGRGAEVRFVPRRPVAAARSPARASKSAPAGKAGKKKARKR
jgi:S-adenosylmethionine hydrolase